ncbi:MAG: F0F1 ATP synthase subunit B [bacterium]|nr:F0F1 ATP synthase subunit B [bacterium]
MLSILQDGLLKVEPGLFIWTLLTFGLLVAVLWKLVWGKVLDGLDGRAAKISSDLEYAKKEREKVDLLLANRKETLLKAKEEALDIINKSKASAIEIKNKILTEAKIQAEALLKKAEMDIEQTRAKALDEFKKDIIDISFQLTYRYLQRDLDGPKGYELLERYLTEYQRNCSQFKPH